MRVAKTALLVLIVVAVGAAVWHYLYVPWKYRQDTRALATLLESCTSSEFSIREFLSGATSSYTIEGRSGDLCRVQFSMLGGERLVCAFPVEDLPGIAGGYRRLAESVDLFGNVSFSYDSADPDPLTVALSSETCAVER